LIGLLGEIEVDAVAGIYPLGARDVLRVSTPMYALQNVGLTDALYVAVGSKPRGRE
jgi:hypothetical protein